MEDPPVIFLEWFRQFSQHVSSGDDHALISLISPNGWLRDQLVFEWNCRSLKGHKDIKDYLAQHLKRAEITNLHLEGRDGIPPAFAIVPHTIEAAFTFETPLIWGRGFVMLQQLEETSSWTALSVCFSATDLKGHEENTQAPSGYYDEHRKNWQDVFEEEKKKIEQDPLVIIVGAAQNGLSVGARFRQMNIPTLLLEQNDRVGDNWRQRYPSLTLHTPKSHHTLLYTTFPDNWPRWTPRDKVASMLEQYSINQELVVWNRSTILPTPSYDPVTRRWTVEVLKNGEKVTLKPYHIVLAIGLLGKPYIPPLLDAEMFHGPKFHAQHYQGYHPFENKNVVVVGASQTSMDICQNLALHNISVTMVQRSSLIIISNDYVHRTVFDAAYFPNVELRNADFRFLGTGFGFWREFFIAGKDQRIADQKEMIDGVLKAGLHVDEGKDGEGQFIRVYGRLGGYSQDIGAADLIIKGKIKIKRGEPERFTADGLVFKDGTFLQADAVIFATGYEPAKSSVLPIFGEAIASKITPIWGFNEVHELRRTYSPSGQPGLWWAVGEFAVARYASKALGIQIKARLLGMITDEDESSNKCFL